MRRLIIVVVLVLLCYLTYETAWLGEGMLKAPTYQELIKQKGDLDLSINTLDMLNKNMYTQKKKDLSAAVELYEKTKGEYEDLAAEQKQLAYDSTDLYDIEFLWTQIGNYATDHSVVLQFDVLKSIAASTESTEYTICDLEFTAIGEYIGVTDFIYDIEDDDRFKFEITEFTMVRPEVEEIVDLFPEDTPEEILERKVKGTFKVKNLPVNASTISSVGEQAVEDATNEIEETVSGSGITQAVS